MNNPFDQLRDVHFGIGIFACCGEPHVVYTSSGMTREEAQADFAEALVNAIPAMGIAKQSFLLTMSGQQFMEIESHYHDIPLPEPEVRVVVVDSPEMLAEVLKDMGIDRDTEAGPAQTHGPHATKQ